MARLCAYRALVLGCLGVTTAQSDFDFSDSPTQEQMAEAISARSVMRARNVIQRNVFGNNLHGYDINGTRYIQDDAGFDALVPGSGNGGLTFVPLNLNETTMVTNNLGGMGPYNANLSFMSAALYGASCASSTGLIPQDRDCKTDPNFVSFDDIGVQAGIPISMRIDNITVYEPANPIVNFFNGDPFQLNLRPIYDLTAGRFANNASEQPFAPEVSASSDQGVVRAMRKLLSALEINYRAENSNLVSLYFQFYSSISGLPMTLEETLIAFYDFDQDFADGDKAYIRESMFVTDFSSMFTSNTTQLELEFSSTLIEKLKNPADPAYMDPSIPGQMSYDFFEGALKLAGIWDGGILPIQTFENWPMTENRHTSILRPRGWPEPTQCQGSLAAWPPMAGGRYCKAEGDGPTQFSLWFGLDTDADLRRHGRMYNYNPYATGCSLSARPCVGAEFDTAGFWSAYGPPNGYPAATFPTTKFLVSGASLKFVTKPGALLRSTRLGLGASNMPTHYHEGCKNNCQVASVASNCHINTLETTSQTDPRLGCNSLFTWTGCGFTYSNRAAFSDEGTLATQFSGPIYNGDAASGGTPLWNEYPAGLEFPQVRVSSYCQATTSAFINPQDSALYDDVVPCILDCPRTDQVVDQGNPRFALEARYNKQQQDRSATFVFRNTQHFTITFMTQIGTKNSKVMDLTNQAFSATATYNPGYPDYDRDTMTAPVNFVDNPGYNSANTVVRIDNPSHPLYGSAFAPTCYEQFAAATLQSLAPPAGTTSYAATNQAMYCVRNDLVTKTGSWVDSPSGAAPGEPPEMEWARGRTRISGKRESAAVAVPVDRAKGRNFLISSADILLPSQPPPSNPPPLYPPPPIRPIPSPPPSPPPPSPPPPSPPPPSPPPPSPPPQYTCPLTCGTDCCAYEANNCITNLYACTSSPTTYAGATSAIISQCAVTCAVGTPVCSGGVPTCSGGSGSPTCGAGSLGGSPTCVPPYPTIAAIPDGQPPVCDNAPTGGTCLTACAATLPAMCTGMPASCTTYGMSGGCMGFFPDPSLAGCSCSTTTTTTTSCTACSDPHLALAHGGRADFKGEHNAWYNLLSARNTTFNALFQHDDFKNPYKLVHGSAMKSTTWVLRTNVTGRTVTVEFNASATLPYRALVKVSDSAAGVWVHHGTRPFQLENVRVEMRDKKLEKVNIDAPNKRGWHGTALHVSTGLWRVSAWNKPFPNAQANPGKALLNINIEPLYNADADPVAPHGIIGQSWDGDDKPMDGLLDDYTGSEVTTKAMGEGAIEGDAADYKLRHKFATHFKYSRFDATAARHRDVSKMAPPKRVRPALELDELDGVGAVADLPSDGDDEEEPTKTGLLARIVDMAKRLVLRQ